MGKNSYIEHNFYCIGCGNKGIPLQRSRGHLHEKFHRKKLYCRYCKTEINHIECRTYDEIEEFKSNFLKGVYEDEATASVSYVRDTRVG